MMTNETNVTNEAFEKWYVDKYGSSEALKKALNHPHLSDGTYLYERTKDRLDVWASVSHHYEREIEREKGRADAWVNGVRILANQLGLSTENSNGSIADWKLVKRQITKLTAQVNQLREALNSIVKYEHNERNSHLVMVQQIAYDALAATAPQSLITHDDELYDRCINIIEEWEHKPIMNQLLVIKNNIIGLKSK